MKFCAICSYYMFLQDDATAGLTLRCRHCGYNEKMAPKSSTDALVLETNFAAAGSQTQMDSQLNDYTKLDPTLPRLKTIPCPNPACATQTDPATRNILYIKTDAKNLKYQYCCTVCNTQWSS
jgi:hypothetical protein